MRYAVLVLIAVVGCRKHVHPSEPAVRADPVTKLVPEAGVPAPDFGPGPVAIVPAVPAFEHGMMDHATRYGWSHDNKWFGYCATNGGRGDTRCDFHSATPGPRLLFSDWNDIRDEEDPAKRAAMEKRLAAMDVRAKSDAWAFARDLELTWDTPDGATLRVGARVRGEPPSFPIVLRDTSKFASEGSVHPEVIAVSPDGTMLGAIGHAFHGEFSDRMLVGLLPVIRVAAHAYNDAGYAHHKKGDYKRAAELFALAVAADATFALPSYNLACAYARLSDPRAESALRAAIALDPTLRMRARADEDLAPVRSAAWFSAAVPPH